MASFIDRARAIFSNTAKHDGTLPTPAEMREMALAAATNYRGRWVSLLNNANSITGGILQDAYINPADSSDPDDIGTGTDPWVAYTLDTEKDPYRALMVIFTNRRFWRENLVAFRKKTDTVEAADAGKTKDELLAQFDADAVATALTVLGDDTSETES